MTWSWAASSVPRQALCGSAFIDGGDQVAAGRPLRADQGGGPAVGPALAGPGGGVIEWRGADGDAERGDHGDGVGSLVAVVEVAGGGAFDLAGAEAGPAGGQQGGQDGAADDAGQVGRVIRPDPLGCGELVACGFQGGGEAGPVGVGAGPGLDGGDHGHAQQLVDGEQGP